MKKLLLLLLLSLGFIGSGLTASTSDIVKTNILKLKAVNICLGVNCVLNEADLSGAKLRSADLSGADLKGAKISEAKFCKTKTPWGQDDSGCL